MNASPPPTCPFQENAPSPQPEKQPVDTWPPGPDVRFTGWSLLWRMSRDLLGTLQAWQREFGDVVHLRIWPEDQVVIADPRLARELLVSHHDALIRWERGMRVFAQTHGDSVFIAEGESWRARRSALQPAFSMQASQRFIPLIATAIQEALADWPAHDPHWPIESRLTSLSMDVIMRLTFSSAIGESVRPAEEAVRTALMAANAEFYWPASWPDWVPWKRAKRRALSMLREMIRQQLQSRLDLAEKDWPDDLLTRLLALHTAAPQTWTLQVVRDECLATFLAGHETIAATLTWWAWCMAANPAAQAIARNELDQLAQAGMSTVAQLPTLAYLRQTLQEAMRLHPAAPVLNSRRSTRPIVLGQWTFPTGTLFMLPIHLLQHDPRNFPDPRAFCPERFAADAARPDRGACMPFGIGPRVCLGQHLAMTEMHLVATLILQHFSLSVPDGMPPPKPKMHVSLRPEHALHLAIRRR